MNTIRMRWLRHALVVVAAGTLFAGCAADAPVAPSSSQTMMPEAPAFDAAAIDLPDACQELQAPAGNEFAMQVYATGVQIYRWDGSKWAFVGPSALLYADAGRTALVGSHYGGPTWESLTGSKVKATVEKNCRPDPNSVAWLLLRGVSSTGPGVFKGVTYIQRINTAGGIEPSYSGTQIGEEARVPYTTEYLFYKAQ